MDLRTSKRHLWGQSVDVRGTIYEISEGGIARAVSEEHAALLLQNPNWTSLDASPAAQTQTTNDDARLVLRRQTPRGLIEIARGLGLSVLGRNAEMLIEDILAKRAAQDAARALEEAQMAMQPPPERTLEEETDSAA